MSNPTSSTELFGHTVQDELVGGFLASLDLDFEPFPIELVDEPEPDKEDDE